MNCLRELNQRMRDTDSQEVLEQFEEKYHKSKTEGVIWAEMLNLCGSQAALDESVRRGDVWSEKDPTSGQEWWFRRRIQKVHKKGMKEVSRYPVHPSFS